MSDREKVVVDHEPLEVGAGRRCGPLGLGELAPSEEEHVDAVDDLLQVFAKVSRHGGESSPYSHPS